MPPSHPGRRLRSAMRAFTRQPTTAPECELLMAETSCSYLLLFLSALFFSLAMSSSGSVAFSASISGCRYWTARAPGVAGVTGVTRTFRHRAQGGWYAPCWQAERASGAAVHEKGSGRHASV